MGSDEWKNDTCSKVPHDDEEREIERENRNLMSIIPNEIWRAIFKNLNDPKDLIAVSGTSSQFYWVLRDVKPLWAMQIVFPLIYSELDAKSILSCRSVCREWRTVVDSFLQTHYIRREHEPYGYRPTKTCFSTYPPDHSLQFLPSLLQKHMNQIYLRNQYVIQDVIADFRNHPGNPFPLRNLVIFNEGYEDDEYWPEVNTLLSLHGQHIWHATIKVAPTDLQETDNLILGSYKLLRSTLQKMPNLKTLVIFFEFRVVEDDPAYQSELITYINANPLPDLPQLCMLDFIVDNYHAVAPLVRKLVEQYSERVKIFNSSVSDWNTALSDYRHFSDLVVLILYVDESPEKVDSFLARLYAPQLRKLSVNLSEDVNISELLRSIKLHLPHVVYLKFYFHYKTMDFSNTGPPEFTLDTIKTLEISDGPAVPYDRLLSHLPALEYILLCINDDPPEQLVGGADTEYEIQKWAYSGRMYESSVWRKLKSLKEFVCGWLCERKPMADLEDEVASTQHFTREIYLRKTQSLD